MNPRVNGTAESGASATSSQDNEYQAVTSGAGFRILDGRTLVRVIGDDRVSFLHGMCSNEIRALAPGSIVPALFLTEHAHVIAEFNGWVLDGAILLELERGIWPRVREHLEKFLVADDVEMEELGDSLLLDIEGPASAKPIGEVFGEQAASLEPWHYLMSGDVMVGNVPRVGLAAFTVVARRQQATELVEGLKRAAGGVAVVGGRALETVRIERGLALVGVDTAEKTIALEARLDRGISFSKGCYVGQETLERATARGALKKQLCGVRIEAQRAPQTDAAVLLDGREVGRLTSVTLSPRLGPIGIGILHHSAWKEGTAVIVRDASGDLAGVVSDLPFE